jgi:hypothetical protein
MKRATVTREVPNETSGRGETVTPLSAFGIAGKRLRARWIVLLSIAVVAVLSEAWLRTPSLSPEAIASAAADEACQRYDDAFHRCFGPNVNVPPSRAGTLPPDQRAAKCQRAAETLTKVCQ